MVDGIGHSCCRVLGIDREGIGRVKERAGREQMRVDIGHLVVGLRAGDDSSGIVLAACSGQGKDVHNRQCSQCRSLSDNQVPSLAVVFGTSGNGFRTVEYRTATHRKNHVNLLFLADAYAFHYTGGVFGVRLDATQFKDFKVFQQFFHAVVQTDTLDASATRMSTGCDVRTGASPLAVQPLHPGQKSDGSGFDSQSSSLFVPFCRFNYGCGKITQKKP